jgi:outer membrane lipoprotein SlyB
MGNSKLLLCKALLAVGTSAAFTLAGCSKVPPPAAPAAVAAVTTPMVAPAPAAVVAPVVTPAPTATPKPIAHKTVAKPVHHTADAPAAATAEATAAATAAPEATRAPAREPIVVCTTCGVITAITPVKNDGKGTGIGVVAGGLAGLVLGNQIGGGSGKTIAKIAGAAGGAFVGNEVEKKARAQTSYEIRVRLDDGTETTVTEATEPRLAVGAAVKIVDGNVVAR